MIIHTLWGLRKGKFTPELMVAWDEFSVDNYQEGFAEDCEKVIASWGSDLVEKRYIDIHVHDDLLMRTFNPVELKGEIR